jgi:hypothetical protein
MRAEQPRPCSFELKLLLRVRRCALCTAFEPEFERVAAAFDGAAPPAGDDAPLLFGRCAAQCKARFPGA